MHTERIICSLIHELAKTFNVSLHYPDLSSVFLVLGVYFTDLLGKIMIQRAKRLILKKISKG